MRLEKLPENHAKKKTPARYIFAILWDTFFMLFFIAIKLDNFNLF